MLKLPFHLFIVLSVFALAGVSCQTSEQSDIRQAAIKVKFSHVIVLEPREFENIDMIRPVQQRYIDQEYHGYATVMVLHIKDDDGRFIQVHSLKDGDGRKANMYFDMTDVYAKLKKKDRETAQKIRDLEKGYGTFMFE